MEVSDERRSWGGVLERSHGAHVGSVEPECAGEGGHDAVNESMEAIELGNFVS
jgi:hypothetical protein